MTAAATASANLTKLRRRARLSEDVERATSYIVVAALVVWIAANLIKSPSQFFAAFLIGINNGTLYALIALGYTMVYGIIELINFAHGDLFMLGTVVSANFLTKTLGVHDAGLSGVLAMLVTMVISMAMCALLNVGTEFIAYRRLRNAPKLAPLITAVGFSFIFQDFGQITNGSAAKTWPLDTTKGPSFSGLYWYNFGLIILVTAPLLALMSWIVTKTRQGKAMRAVAADQDGARLMGINVNRTVSFTFALGGALAGAAGTLYIYVHATNNYNLGLRLGLIAFTAAVLGGIGNLVGAVIGGLIIGIIEAVSDGAPYGLGQAWSETVIFTILIALMVFRPEGLLGRRTTEKV
jgi:branched-chain amino acid transport system permease protein